MCQRLTWMDGIGGYVWLSFHFWRAFQRRGAVARVLYESCSFFSFFFFFGLKLFDKMFLFF